MSGRRHILVFPSWYPTSRDPQLGIFIQKQLQALAKHHRITVAFAQRGTKNELISIENGGIRELIYTYKSAAVLSFLGWRKAYREVLRELQNETFDLVHLQVAYPAGMIATAFAREKELPLITSEHWSGYGFDDQFTGWMRRRITRAVFKHSKRFLVVSPWLKEKIEWRGYSGPIDLVPNIIPQLPYHSPESTEEIQIYNIADHVDRDKNISGLLEAFARLLPTHPKLTLVQIGSGPDTEMLRTKARTLGIEQQVQFKGRLSNENVLREIRQASFGIINSHVETFSVVTFEFLAAGKPVILTRCGGPEHYFDESLGMLIDPGQPNQLDAALAHMVQHCTDYSPKELSSYVQSRFSSEAVAQQINQAYEAIWQEGTC